jgi:cytochrome c5
MRRLPTPGFALFAAVIVAACSSTAPADGPAPTPQPTASAPEAAPAPETAPASPAASDLKTPNTLEGIYTPEQAERGLAVFENICSECHETVEWQDELFLARWDGEAVYRFWHYIYERMPHGSTPYSLPRQTVSDVVTYILQLNGVPAGDVELGTTDDDIDQHWLYWGNRGPAQ